MMNARKIGGGTAFTVSQPQKIWKGGKALKFLFPLRLPKGGLRWNNTSEIGGVING